MWQYIKINATNHEVDSALERLGGRDLKLHTRAKVQRFQFGSKVQGALDVLRVRPQSLNALLAAKLLDADTLKRAIYTLAVTRHLDLGREDLEPMGVAAADSKYPAPRTTERRVRRRFEPVRPKQDSSPQEPVKVAAGVIEELQALLERLDSLTYYELLGVPPDATMSMIQGAFLGQAKKWHPDKWRGEQAGSRDDAARIFARISEAHQILTNEEQRKEYDRLRKSKGQEAQEQETVRQVLRAAGAFQKAQILAKKNDYAAAEEAAKMAFEGDPTQAEYGAFYAWLVTQNPQNKEKDFDTLIAILNRSVDDEPQSVPIRLYRAVVLKRAGKMNESMRDFRFVNDQQPNNVEAARELRLHKMRVEESKSNSGTLLNKLFKK
jgi:curved DNA-binding protein CbpA